MSRDDLPGCNGTGSNQHQSGYIRNGVLSMLSVGLTGGIACGKSLVLGEFQKLGVYGLDADRIARQVVEQGRPAHREIVLQFGESILGQDGAIDRQKLGQLVFSDGVARANLNRIVHPCILAEEKRRIAVWQELAPATAVPIVMVDAALMLETGSYRNYDRIIVVYCRPEIQLQRLRSRDGLSRQEALERIHSQMPVEEKAKHADHVIDNSGKPSQTRSRIQPIFRELLARARQAQAS